MMDTWHSLLRFESRDLVTRTYKARHGREPSQKRVSDITANFVQAREYFTNAARAAITVKPLLQFYGVRALTHGLILSVSTRKDASALKPSHGLKEVSWLDRLRDNALDFGNLEVQLQKGTFWELIEATENRSYFKKSSSGVNWQFTFPIPSIGTRVSFTDVVSSMADVSKDYSAWMERSAVQATMESFKFSSDQRGYEISLSSNTADETIRRVLQHLELNITIPEAEGYSKNKIVSIPASHCPYFSQLSDRPLGIGHVLLVPPIQGSVYLNTLSQYYMLSYILGMVVRYFPSIWISLSRQAKGDSIFPLLNRLMDVIQGEFPQVVWDFLQSPYDFEIREREVN